MPAHRHAPKSMVCLVVAALASLVAPTRSFAADPNGVGTWCPYGGYKWNHATAPFIVPPALPSYEWTLLVMNTTTGVIETVASPVVGASYSDPGGADFTWVILCEQSTAPPPTTTLEPTTTTVEATTTTIAPTTTIEPPTTTSPATTTPLPTTTTTSPTTTAPSPSVAPTSAGPIPTVGTTAGPVLPPPHTPGPPATAAGTTIVASQAPVPAGTTAGEPTSAGTTTSGEVTTTAAVPDRTTTTAHPGQSTTTDGRTAPSAGGGVNVATFRAKASDVVAHHPSADGFVFFVLLAAFGAGVFFTGRHHR